MRLIGENVKNKLNIKDPFSGDVLHIYYRSPTSEERVKYFSAQFEIVDGKVDLSPSKGRLELGAAIILGFDEGDFGREVDGEPRPYSSDPESPSYEAGWKDLLMKFAPDILEALALHAFEGARSVASQVSNEEKRQKNL